MAEKEVLLKQFDEIRKWTLTLAGDFTDEEARQVAEPLRTSLVWNLGHLAVIDNEALQLIFGQSALDESFIAKFKSGTHPSGASGATKDEVLKNLAAVRKTLRNKLSRLRPVELNKKPKQKTWYKNVREAIYLTALHEGYHAGKIGTLRRFMGKPALFG